MGEKELISNLKPELPDIVKIPKYFTLSTVYLVYLMILVYTIGFSYYTIMKHLTFQTAAYDLGIFINSFYNTIYEGKFLYTTLWEGSRFQNHFSPILFLLLPIYKVFPRVETLLIIQSFILAIGALPIYWIAKNEINKKAGLIFALLYLTYPALQGINKFDFHEVAFAPAFILFAFHYYKQKSYTASSFFMILALISREDVAMVVVPMAILWILETKNKSVKNKDILFCSSIIILGTIWFLICTLVIIPYYNPQGYWFIKEYSMSFLLISINKKAQFLVNLFLPLLFTSILNKWILVAFPILARNLLSNKPTRFEITNQNQALLTPFVFISSIYFIKTASEHINNEQFKSLFSKKLIYPILMSILIINFFTSPIPPEIKKNSIIPQMNIIPDGGPSPITGIMPITPHDIALNTVINMIPRNASLYAQSNLFTHVADRPRVYYVPGDFQIFKGWNNPQIALVVPWREASDFDYILVDDKYPRKSTLRNADLETIDKIKQNYGIYVAIDDIYLFKKGFNGTDDPDPPLLSSFDNHFLPNYYNGIIIDYYNNDNLTGNPVVIERVSNISFNWKKVSPIPGIINQDNFSAKLEGNIYIPTQGSYIFEILSDDRSRLYIDNQLVIDTWQSTPPIQEYYKATLNIGLHKIRVDYVERVNTAYINVLWYTPWKGIYENIPEEYLYIPKDNVDNIYNGGEITNPINLIANNADNVSKMRNDNTATINYTPIPTPVQVPNNAQQTPNNAQENINSIPLDTINTS